MKKVMVIILFLVMSVSAFAFSGPIEGGFSSGVDGAGNNITYFQGRNITQYNLALHVYATNDITNERLDWQFVLYSGNSFTISPSNGWTWMAGEKLWIQYADGQVVYWVYAPTKYDISFTGKRSCQVTGCRCEKYISKHNGYSKPWGIECRTCGHKPDYHIR